MANVGDIEDRVDAIRALGDFDIPIWWLTFSLTASWERLALAAKDLSALKAVNLTGAESGFLHAKLPVESRAQPISVLLELVIGIAKTRGVEVIAVDVDTSADAALSKFEELVSFSSPRTENRGHSSP